MLCKLCFIENIITFWNVFDIVTDSLFFTDIMINFISSYYNEQGILETSRSSIAKQFFKQNQ